jgi:DNA adenine methylase
MRYFGGKARLAKTLGPMMDAIGALSYWEPFCGMFNVGSQVTAPRAASDQQEDIILLLNAVSRGWEPPSMLSEELYNTLKTTTPSAMRGFAGFGCSFGGKFFGGYAREKGRNFAANAARSLVKLRPCIQGVTFLHGDYRALDVKADLIYCDPPYAGTVGWGFDHEVFWDWVRARSQDSQVLVSEYVAPPDFETVWAKAVRTDMNSATGKIPRVEKIFQLTRH